MWKNFVGNVIGRIYDVITFISNTLILRAGAAIFADIIKIKCFCHVCHVFITIYKNSRKVKINRNHIKIQSISVFLDIAKFAEFRWKNADVSRTQAVCHVIHIIFGSSLGTV